MMTRSSTTFLTDPQPRRSWRYGSLSGCSSRAITSEREIRAPARKTPRMPMIDCSIVHCSTSSRSGRLLVRRAAVQPRPGQKPGVRVDGRWSRRTGRAGRDASARCSPRSTLRRFPRRPSSRGADALTRYRDRAAGMISRPSRRPAPRALHHTWRENINPHRCHEWLLGLWR